MKSYAEIHCPANELAHFPFAGRLRGASQNLSQSLLVSVQGERQIQQVLVKLLHCPHTPQRFFLYCIVIAFCG